MHQIANLSGHGKADPIAAVVVGLSRIAAAIVIILESIPATAKNGCPHARQFYFL
jgi:divalent metal cation (Fe/Co/Zn/Cd) transporter